jgi:hypothetical protein
MLSEAHPIIRRIIRFISLPHFFILRTNWEKCSVSKLQAAFDMLYIFFVLKYHPENYSKCQLWDKPRSEWRYYYGSLYDPWQRWKLRNEVFPYKYRYVYNDKSINYLICRAYDIALPKWHGIVTPSNFKSKLTELFNNNESVSLIVKPIEGSGGHGVIFASKSNDEIRIREKNEDFMLDQYSLRENCIIQEFIHQHEKLNLISKSINTIRIVTMLTKSDDIIILGARMRFGVGDSFLDNTCQGGIAVNIDLTKMTLERYAYDNRGVKYSNHPTSNYKFEGFVIPYWQEVIDLAVKVQECIQYNKLIGQDIAITDQGPVIIELNAEYDNVMFEQACGPLLKNKRLLKEFNEYDLLFNKQQKALLHNSHS